MANKREAKKAIDKIENSGISSPEVVESSDKMLAKLAQAINQLSALQEGQPAENIQEVLEKFLAADSKNVAEVQDLKELLARASNPNLPDVGENEASLTVMSSTFYQLLREAVAKNSFSAVDGTPWPTASLESGQARGHAQLRPPAMDAEALVAPEEAERWAQLMWRQREELSDLDADALDLLSHLWLQQASSAKDFAVADVDQFLTMRGLKPKQSGDGRRGGFEPEQRAEMLKALSHIQNLWLKAGEIEFIEQKGRGRRKRIVKEEVQSRAFVITDRVGRTRLDGDLEVRRFIFQPGHLFAQFLFGPGRQTALLSAKAVQYDPYRQKWEKRLARYLSWQWRTQARRGEYVRRYRVNTLLETTGTEINSRYPSKTKDRLEKVLDTLRDDNVIAGWHYDQWDEEIMNRPGWAKNWEQVSVVIEPPELIRENYKSLPEYEDSRAGQSGGLLEPPSLAEQIKARRKTLGLTQAQAAEQLGIAQSYLSKLERGQVMPSEDFEQQLNKWLED